MDKHSSGGVGDKTSLVGPLVASLGVPVGKMSGRGLSFSGGTLDKLESIPGLACRSDAGCLQAPTRRHWHGHRRAVRTTWPPWMTCGDVTGMVPRLPLIASSIMSKKIASGADAIVLDVKTGSGAFIKTLADAGAQHPSWCRSARNWGAT